MNNFIFKIKKFIKELFGIKSNENEKDTLPLPNVSNEYSFGTVVWAKRYKTVEEMNEIAYGHRVGPYVYVGKNDDSNLFLYCTSREYVANSNEFLSLILLSEDYKELDHNTSILVPYVVSLDDDQIVRELCELNHEDVICLRKKMKIVSDDNLYRDFNIQVSDIEIGEKDIIKKDSIKYLVIEKREDGFFCIPLKPINDSKCLNIDGIHYQLLYDKSCTITDIDNYKRVSVLSSKKFKYVLKKFQDYLTYVGTRGVLKRGSLISLDDCYYYVYGEISDCFQAFEVYTDDNENFEKIIVDDIEFYTDFEEQLTFSKNNNFVFVITSANEDEMDFIKKKKKEHKKLNKDNSKKKSKNKRSLEIQSGALVTTYDLKQEQYLVICRYDTNLIVVSYDEIEDGNYHIKKVDVRSVYYNEMINPLVFKKVLNEINERLYLIKGKISQDNFQKLLKKNN